MKNKHYIKTVEDIKYCEEKGLTLFSEDDSHYFKFERGCWNEFEGRKLWLYHAAIDPTDVYYYEEEPEEQQEVTEKDVGKLCWFFNKAKDGVDIRRPFVAILWRIDNDFKYPFVDDVTGLHWQHCRRLSPAEVAEITGYKVEKAE